MGIDIFEWSDNIDMRELGLELNAGRARLNSRLKAILGSEPSTSSEQTPANLQEYIDLFAEQVTADPVIDMFKYFELMAGQGITLGGLPTGYPPLAILPRDPRPSNTAISAIGEGLVGWYMQQRGLRLLSRPIGDGPDFVLEDAGDAFPRTFLVEVKSTQQSGVKAQMSDAAYSRLQYTLNAANASPDSKFSCCISGVIIESSNDFRLLNLEIRLT